VLVLIWLIMARTGSACSWLAQKTSVFSRWSIWLKKISARLRSRSQISIFLLKSPSP